MTKKTHTHTLWDVQIINIIWTVCITLLCTRTHSRKNNLDLNYIFYLKLSRYIQTKWCIVLGDKLHFASSVKNECIENEFTFMMIARRVWLHFASDTRLTYYLLLYSLRYHLMGLWKINVKLITSNNNTREIT